MIASLEKLIDWSAIQVMTLMMPASEYDCRLEEALRFLKGPDFVSTHSQPAQVEFNGSLHFRFPTPRPCEFAENNVVHGRLYRCPERWQERPVIILLPGYNDSLPCALDLGWNNGPSNLVSAGDCRAFASYARR